MIYKFLMFFLFVIKTLLLSVFAADNEVIKDYFQSSFYSSYQEGKCGLNIDGFLKKLVQSRVDVSGVLLVHIDGGGDLWAYSTRNGNGSPDRSVWFHHYIMLLPPKNLTSEELSFSIDNLLDYEVIDFDFLNEPTIIQLKSYLSQMFIPTSMRNNPERIQKDFNLALIKFDFVDAYQYSKSLDSLLTPSQAKEARNRSLVMEKVKFKVIYKY